MEELSYVLTQYFVSCVHVRFYFSLPHIFTLLATSISHCLTAALNFHFFLPTKFVSITRSSSFSVIHVSVNIKNNVEKDTTLLLFFLCKSPGGHAISFRCIWVAIPVDWIIWHWYACGADGRSGRQAVGVRSRDYQIFSDGKFTIFFYLWCSAARSARARAPL